MKEKKRKPFTKFYRVEKCVRYGRKNVESDVKWPVDYICGCEIKRAF